MAVQTKLATIMAVDVAGYSRAAETDQTAAAAAVAQLRARVESVIAPLGGRIFSTAGDGMMVELPAASSGVHAALQLLAGSGEGAEPTFAVRIGVHLGEVIIDERGDLLGHGVNVAARLQALAEPGTAIVSEAVRTQLRTAAEVPLQRLGRVQLDKMATRMSVYALAPGKRRAFARIGWRRARGAIIAAAAVAVLSIGGLLAWRAYGPHAPETPPRLAVLRLETLGDTEPYFSEGLADELITEMSRVRGLDVIARASSFALSGADATPAGAARVLNATLVLTGAVRKIAGQVQVTSQLVEAPSGRQIWTRDFTRPPAEIYELQRDIAVSVALASGLQVDAPPARRVDPDVYALYVRAREAEQPDTDSGYAEAVPLYREAVRRDPNFAAAWAALSRASYVDVLSRLEVSLGQVEVTHDMVEESLRAGERAIALDPASPTAYENRARVLSLLGDWRPALAAAEMAEARGGGVGVVYTRLGYLRRAQESVRRFVELDPLSAIGWNTLSGICLRANNPSCALDAAGRARRVAPGSAQTLAGYTYSLMRSGRRAEAVQLTYTQPQLWEEAVKTHILIDMATLRAILSGTGPLPSAQSLIALLDRREASTSITIDALRVTRHIDAIPPLLERWTNADRPMLDVLFDSELGSVRATPAFWALMEREGVLDVWRATGRWPDFCETEPSCGPYRRPPS
ncbi:MAG: adenylate/guanylate cyclase domain-containing protein [Hyphomonadaceae bacterium]|nr:adenylate/guanylate cyclase domain-containing protein [Hyphomonadaceae bacterium]